MEPLISVIVPVYNVEQYVETCVRSIINQTYKNLEIILVDDGSTDCSGKICDDMARQDERIRVIHKVNGGLSDARNVGIDHATGKLITFVDSDDYLREKMIEKLYTSKVAHEAQISCCQTRIVYENPPKDISSAFKTSEGESICLGQIEAISKFLKQSILCSSCAKLYDTELFQNIRYPKGELNEDLGTTYKIFALSDRVAFIRVEGYCYFMRSGSIQNSKFTKKKMAELKFAKEQKEYLDARFPELELATTDRLVNTCFHILFSVMGQKEFAAEQKEVEQIIRDNRKRLLLAKDISKKTRYGCLLSYMGFRAEALIYNIIGVRGKMIS